MWNASFSLRSLSYYSQSRPHVTPKLNKEASDAFEARTWHHRLHVEDGQVFIPAMALRNCIAEAAKFLSIQIPGKGKSTYTKHFESGILISQNIPLFDYQNRPVIPPTEAGLQRVLAECPSRNDDLDITQALAYEPLNNEVFGDWVFVPSDGVPGSGKRVWKCYPIIPEWQGEVHVQVLDDTITPEVFKSVLSQAGMLIGLGRFRVRNRGTYGRFEIV